MVNSCTIEIDKRESGGTFTNYDTLKGEVKLHVTSSITLNYIQVKIEGISKSYFKVAADKSRRDSKERMLQDVHKILYDSQIVFPPPNIQRATNSKEFTLAPGTYTYPFEFNIPLTSSCQKLSGITNKLSFNKNSFDVILNNGSISSKQLKGTFSQLKKNINGEDTSQFEAKPVSYHVNNVLPPSLSDLGDFASIKYFVKVTCKRSSILKANLRSYDPFVFLPLDDLPRGSSSNNLDEYREVFVRRDAVFRDVIPEVIAVYANRETNETHNEKVKPLPSPPPGRLQNLFSRLGAPSSYSGHSDNNGYKNSRDQRQLEVQARDVPFSFEARFRHPAFLIPDKVPPFKLYIVSPLKPSRYSLAKYGKSEETSGLGFIYFQSLKVELVAKTKVSGVENVGNTFESHLARHTNSIIISESKFHNLKFDLMNAQRLKSTSAQSPQISDTDFYELEIPKSYYQNCILPDYLTPTFRTCNISRYYDLKIRGGFSSEKIDHTKSSSASRMVYIDLDFPNINVLSGLSMTNTLHSNMSSSTINKGDPLRNLQTNTSSIAKPPLEDLRLDEHTYSSNDLGHALPTYDDVIREDSFQSNGEHYQNRRRYHQNESYYNYD